MRDNSDCLSPVAAGLILLFSFSAAAEMTKVANGRIKTVQPEKQELVLSIQNPATGREEELRLKADNHTGFSEGIRLVDFKTGDPVSVDYAESAGALPRAIQIKQVPLTGVPFDKSPFSDSAQINFQHGLKAKQEGNLSAAESRFRRAIEADPDNADFHFELGNLYAEQGNPEWSQREYQQALMIDPGHLASHYNLGLVYWELGEMPEARSEFRRVLEQDPSNVKAQLQIGYIYQAEGFPEDARQAFEKALSMDESNPEPRAALEDLKTPLRSQPSLSNDSRFETGSLLLRQLLAERLKNGDDKQGT